MTQVQEPSIGPRTTGPELAPGDPGYDEARAVWNGAVDRRPAVITRCRRREDVAAALLRARDAGRVVAVRGGGHGHWGAALCDGGAMIHLGSMNGVAVDPTERRARVGGGATLADFDRATQAHGSRHLQAPTRPLVSGG